jgi:hypothetical protein
MRNLKLKILILITWATISVSSCSLFGTSSYLNVPIPPRPALIVCPERPHPIGKVMELEGMGKVVVLKVNDAYSLLMWVNENDACQQENVEIFNGHIEKLEARLKAIGGKK